MGSTRNDLRNFHDTSPVPLLAFSGRLFWVVRGGRDSSRVYANSKVGQKLQWNSEHTALLVPGQSFDRISGIRVPEQDPGPTWLPGFHLHQLARILLERGQELLIRGKSDNNLFCTTHLDCQMSIIQTT